MQYITCVQTAKLIRAALKESFPTVKFSVTSSQYAGGASINIRYINGPTADQVNQVVKVFEGSYFDGMQDYKGQNYANLDGEEVKFGADYVFVNRSYSADFLEGVAQKVAQDYGIDFNLVTIKTNQYSGSYIDCPATLTAGGRYFNQMVNITMSEVSLADPFPSKTLARVYSMGDDGYGYGCVGRLAA
jgi:hypothetical protein